MWGRIYRHTVLEAVNKLFLLLPSAAAAPMLRMLGAGIGRRCRIYTPLLLTNTAFSNLHLGDDGHIGRDVLLDTCGRIQCGHHVVISMRCTLLTHTIMGVPALRERGYEDVRAGIEIGDNVYLGAGATVLPGVHIGENCIIAAGAVVHRDVPPNSLAAGVPAKVVKRIKAT